MGPFGAAAMQRSHELTVRLGSLAERGCSPYPSSTPQPVAIKMGTVAVSGNLDVTQQSCRSRVCGQVVA
jgi:hypothetical protein